MRGTSEKESISIQSFSAIEKDSFFSFLNTFHCEKNFQVEEFLKKEALVYEKANISRTFVVVDNNNGLYSKNNILKLLGYFTVALKVLDIPENITPSQKRKICGFRFDGITEVPVYLIGQIGKNDKYSSEISGMELMSRAESVIKEAYKHVGGRIILLECENREKLIKFYKACGYTLLPRSVEDSTNLVQFVKKIM